MKRVVRDAVLASLAMAALTAIAGAMWLRITRAAGDPPLIQFVSWTMFGGAATAVLVVCMSRTFRRTSQGGGTRLTSVGLANTLTLVRFVLIAPTVVLLDALRYPEALVCYVVLFATDVADGIIARRRDETSEFGVIADPLADVASTFAVFTVLWSHGGCPTWLYGLLAFRYAMLIVGSLAFLAAGPVHFQATVPGKIVGVVQAAGASLIIAGAMWGGLPPGVEGPLFAFLGIGFASIVLSQAVIGWRLVRRRMSRGGPTR
jgi:phosphatidylglycerophosphate synthase